MADNRLDRDLEKRERTQRKSAWRRPEVLPTPNPEAGYTFHWVRVSTRGQADAINVSSKLREGWEPVRAVDHPEIFLSSIENERFKDNVVIGGLLLCKAPVELVKERNEYYTNQTRSQMIAVDQNLMRENDPRMPLFTEKRSEVSFNKR